MSAPSLRHPGLNLHDAGTRDRHGAGSRATGPDEAEPAIYGFWIFLMSDAVLFALMFAVYGTQLAATADAPGPGAAFELGPAFVETVILLTSSLTFGLAAVAMKHDRTRTRMVLLLLVTLALGLAFLGFELNDFATMAAKGATPDRSGFLSAFFALVPTHGLHVTAGCAWIAIMLVQVGVFGLDQRVKVNLLRLGLFWHFLDIVWIAIFSVVYLQGLAA